MRGSVLMGSIGERALFYVVPRSALYVRLQYKRMWVEGGSPGEREERD